MRPELEKYQLIDQYLNNKMSAQEALEFEKKLQADPVFYDEVLDQKLTNEVIIENRFFQVIDSIDLAPVAPKPPVSNLVKGILGIGGASLIAVALFFSVNKLPEAAPEEQIVVVDSPVEPIVEENTENSYQEAGDGLAESVVVEENPEHTVTTPGKAFPKKKKEEPRTDGSYIVEIPLKDPGDSDQTDSFNPEQNEWKIPVTGKANAELKIMNKSGVEVYRTTISNGKPDKWNGHNSEGKTLPPGTYIYLLDYGNDKIDHGYVKITGIE